DVDKRREQHQAREWRGAATRLLQHDGGARRLGETEIGSGAERLYGLREHRLEIPFEENEIVDVSLVRVRHRAGGQALPAPVERDDGEAASQQFADRLEILFNEFRAALRK